MILGKHSQTKRFVNDIGHPHYAARCVVLINLCALSLLGFAVKVEASHPATTYVEGEVIVTFKESTDLPKTKTALSAHGLQWAKHFGWLSQHRHRNTGLVRATSRTTASLLDELRQDPAVESVEPNYLRWIATTPNDLQFSQLWGLQNTGQAVNGTSGTPGDDINFVGAWNLVGSSALTTVVVAVIDTGVDYTHPDLVSNMWHNAGEIPGDGLDNDGNGYVDDSLGYDFADNTSDPADSGDHGTHVSGTIAATGNNGLGVIGVAYQARIMALKASADGDTFTDVAVIEAIQYAAMMKNRGVNIAAINASFGGGGFSTTEHDAIQAAGDAGIVFCTAAGNSSANNDTTPTYPASYRLSNMIVVAASDQNDTLASFSNYGATTVDLAAPGVNILSTKPTWLSTTSATVSQGANTYSANGLTFAGTTNGFTATVYNCGLGNPSDFPSAVSGNIALIQRGTLTFADKVANAMAAGATAAIIYNNGPGNFSGTLLGPSAWIPAVSLSQADGQALLAVLPTTATVVNQPAPSQIYQFMDGTSMATPHVAGAVAFAAMNYPAETVIGRIQRILQSVDPVAGLSGKVATGGRLNLGRTVSNGGSTGTTNPVPVLNSIGVSNTILTAGGLPVSSVDNVLYFTAQASETGSNALTYLWTFCDGSTDAHSNAVHQITTPGPCPITISVSDGQRATTSNLTVSVAWAMTVGSVQAKVNFAKSNADSCRVLGTLDLGTGFTVAGKTITLDVGGAEVSFILDTKGRGVSSSGTCRLAYQRQTQQWSLQANLRKGNWQGAWSVYGLRQKLISRPGTSVTIPVVVLVGEDAYAAEQTLQYTTQGNSSFVRSGTAR
jgi:subtilisin family serine protease